MTDSKALRNLFFESLNLLSVGSFSCLEKPLCLVLR